MTPPKIISNIFRSNKGSQKSDSVFKEDQKMDDPPPPTNAFIE